MLTKRKDYSDVALEDCLADYLRVLQDSKVVPAHWDSMFATHFRVSQACGAMFKDMASTEVYRNRAFEAFRDAPDGQIEEAAIAFSEDKGIGLDLVCEWLEAYQGRGPEEKQVVFVRHIPILEFESTMLPIRPNLQDFPDNYCEPRYAIVDPTMVATVPHFAQEMELDEYFEDPQFFTNESDRLRVVAVQASDALDDVIDLFSVYRKNGKELDVIPESSLSLGLGGLVYNPPCTQRVDRMLAEQLTNEVCDLISEGCGRMPCWNDRQTLKAFKYCKLGGGEFKVTPADGYQAAARMFPIVVQTGDNECECVRHVLNNYMVVKNSTEYCITLRSADIRPSDPYSLPNCQLNVGGNERHGYAVECGDYWLVSPGRYQLNPTMYRAYRFYGFKGPAHAAFKRWASSLNSTAMIGADCEWTNNRMGEIDVDWTYTVQLAGKGYAFICNSKTADYAIKLLCRRGVVFGLWSAHGDLELIRRSVADVAYIDFQPYWRAKALTVATRAALGYDLNKGKTGMNKKAQGWLYGVIDAVATYELGYYTVHAPGGIGALYSEKTGRKLRDDRVLGVMPHFALTTSGLPGCADLLKTTAENYGGISIKRRSTSIYHSSFVLDLEKAALPGSDFDLLKRELEIAEGRFEGGFYDPVAYNCDVAPKSLLPLLDKVAASLVTQVVGVAGGHGRGSGDFVLPTSLAPSSPSVLDVPDGYVWRPKRDKPLSSEVSGELHWRPVWQQMTDNQQETQRNRARIRDWAYMADLAAQYGKATYGDDKEKLG